MKRVIFSVVSVLYCFFASGYSQTGFQGSAGMALGDSSQLYVQEIINSKTPVLIDFWAVWCGPCKVLSPVIEEIKKEYTGRIKVLQINIDRNRSLATYFKVVSIPNVFLVKDKIVISSILGVQPKSAYISVITEALGPAKPPPDSIQ